MTASVPRQPARGSGMTGVQVPPADSLAAILAAASGAGDPRRPFPPGQLFDRVSDALGASIVASRLTLRDGRGASVSVVARDRRVLRVVDARPRTLLADGLPTCDDDGAAPLAALIRRLADGAGVLAIERTFLPGAEVTGHHGIGIGDLSRAWEAAGRRAADPLAALRREVEGLPRATLAGGAVTLDLPAGIPDADAAWFRTLAQGCADAPFSAEPMLFVFDQPVPRAVVAIPGDGRLLLAMATTAGAIARLEAVVEALPGRADPR
jgi:hypothetical protein